MDSILLTRAPRQIHHLSGTSDETRAALEASELDLAFLSESTEEVRDREIQALTNRIKILEKALQEARTEAFQAGYEEGKESTTAEARRQFQQMTREFSSNLQRVRSQFEESLEKMDQPLVKLSLSIAERILNHELSDPETAQQLLLERIQKLLNETANQTRAIVHLNTSQLNWITGGNILTQLNVPQKDKLRFVANDSLKPGECLLETEDYLIDNAIPALLKVLEDDLRKHDATVA